MPDSSVKAACCSCAAGLSQCVIQCVKINEAVEQGMFTTTCTVRSCVWNVSAKEIEPTQVRKMSIAEYKQLKESKHFFYDKIFDYSVLLLMHKNNFYLTKLKIFCQNYF